MSSPSRFSDYSYARLDSSDPHNPGEHFFIYEFNPKRIEQHFKKEQERQQLGLERGRKALADRNFQIAIAEFQHFLIGSPQNAEALMGLKIAQENYAKDLGQANHAGRIISQANDEFESVEKEYREGGHSLENLMALRDRLLRISEQYRSVRIYEMNAPMPKYPQVTRLFGIIDKEIMRVTFPALMEQNINALKGLSLKNESHLRSISAQCQAWEQSYEGAGIQPGSEWYQLKPAIEAIHSCAESSLYRLVYVGEMFVRVMDLALTELNYKWKISESNCEYLNDFYKDLFENSPLLRKRFISLTPEGINSLEKRINVHMKSYIRDQRKAMFARCFFLRTMQRKLRARPPIQEADILHWMEELCGDHSILDISDRLGPLDEKEGAEAGAPTLTSPISVSNNSQA